MSKEKFDWQEYYNEKHDIITKGLGMLSTMEDKQETAMWDKNILEICSELFDIVDILWSRVEKVRIEISEQDEILKKVAGILDDVDKEQTTQNKLIKKITKINDKISKYIPILKHIEKYIITKKSEESVKRKWR